MYVFEQALLCYKVYHNILPNKRETIAIFISIHYSFNKWANDLRYSLGDKLIESFELFGKI